MQMIGSYSAAFCQLCFYNKDWIKISSTNLHKRFGEWQEALESKGLKVNADKTETIVCKDSRDSADQG